jgi:alpha-glucoside transport system substrate-binding protein
VAAEGDPKVMLGGGELLSITNNRPEVLDAVLFLSSADYANARAVQGSWISANKGLDTSVIPDELDKQFADLLLSSDVFRFDASDMMPGEVGAGSFWKETTAWIVGGSTSDMLDNIEASWPKA